MVYQDEYHAEARFLAKQNYYCKGGRVKTSIRRYLQRYNLDKQMLNHCATDSEKLEYLKDFIKKKNDCNWVTKEI